mgnify:CR=1 FL=1
MVMEVELKLEPGRQEPKVVILAGEDSPALERLREQLSGLSLGPIPVWRGERALLVRQEEFLRFFADGKGVSAQTGSQVYAVRLRLYELEERLDATRFVRISNSEIVNLDRGFLRVSHSELVNSRKITALDLSLTGTIRMTLGDGAAVCYVSRRYVKKIKETLERRGAR